MSITMKQEKSQSSKGSYDNGKMDRRTIKSNL